MKLLPKLIRKGGFELALILRTGRVAIYRQHWPGSDPDHDAYEVILPQVRKTNHKGEPVEAYECYPPAESWGKKGWTFMHLAKAVQKLLQLTRKASRAGTVSRKNRLNGRPRIRERRLLRSASRLVSSGNYFTFYPAANAPVLRGARGRGLLPRSAVPSTTLAPNQYERSHNDKYN